MGDLGPALTVAELGRIVRGVEPSAFVVPGRIVRRAIKHDRGLPAFLLRVPHRVMYTIDRDSALEVITLEELGLQPDEPLPSTLILMAEPDAEELSDRPRTEILRDFWRRLFHSRIHIELGHRFAIEGVTSAGLRERITRIDLSAFEEARSVLRGDDLLFPPRDDLHAFIEFAAVYLSIRAFAEHLLPRFFPAIRDSEAVDRLLAEDVDAEALLASTRLPGSAEIAQITAEEEDQEPEPIVEPEPEHEAPSVPEYRRLLAKAMVVEGRGNLVRAAILRTHAARLAGPSLAGQARSSARDAMHLLAGRLKAALGFDDKGLREWRLALVAPLERSSRGFWTPEARLLYDLQKVCFDHERPFYAIDLVEWTLSLGRRPIKRLLPNHQDVLMMQHLQGAAKHLAAARLPDADRVRFSKLLTEAVHRAEGQLRDRFRPEIVKVLDQTGFEARDLPERVALQKINEELLDRVVHRGFLSMGDLRDALSRNNRKLPDLAGPREFFQGDRLLRANRRLALALDGVYHRGEIYLRILQRLSSLAFGTRTGRLLTRFLVLPYGGAAVILEGLQHVVGPISEWVIGDEMRLLNPLSLAIDGTVAIGLLYSKEYRQATGRFLRLGFEVLQHVLIGLPSWVLRREWLRKVFASRIFSLTWRGAILPLSLAGIVYSVRPASVSPIQSLVASGLIFLSTSLLLTTRAGRNLEEMTLDSLGRIWSWLVSNLIPGLFRMVMELFDRVLESIERVIYTVDEWLRFRGGQGKSSLASKAILGLAWFFIAYVVRFVVTLLIEPQVNPIKHFPVVTVSHKIMLTQLFRVEGIMTGLFGSELGPPIAVTVLGLIPGIFGFLVWELKENWRLYEANRPLTLRPVVIGHHGETMARLLKPGFHSGTVPKVFAKLRRAERKALRTGYGKWARNQLARLHGVEEDVRHFVDRDFLTILLQSRSMGATPLAIGAVVPGTKRFLIELIRPGRVGPGLWLSFEEHSGWLVAGIVETGWLADLTSAERNAFGSALMGLYKMAGVEIVREPIVEALGPEPWAFDFREEGLVVWPSETSSTEILYLLRPLPGAPPLVTINDEGDPAVTDPPSIDTARLMFSTVEITWKDWVALWERDRAGHDLATGLISGRGLLPALPEASGLKTQDTAVL